ncbi:uncharacterized protein LOC107770375 [Nicotiana tabacum]|uniref:Uncharacterized protein LOC107770375 n=1 Tax=Nicotiana tabacum TaxID=4097 RepID=A0A1S3XYZ3_TOBAC|nr:PREDICTED: uncharacterized protein LOC107770375 [Nicotiana tabacum]XP_018633017.1 uncharacterized protein LOC104115690 [Nicotiana tomentosiformis]
MDLEEWEVLPEDGFLEIHDDGGNKIFSRKFISDSNRVFHDYFSCSTPNPCQFVHSTVHPRVPKQLIPLSIQLEPRIQKTQDDDHEVSKEVITTQVPFEITISEKIKPPAAMMETEQDQALSQVFFKKMKDTESRLTKDMKVDLHKTFVPQIDQEYPFPFEENSEVIEIDKDIVIKKMKMEAEIIHEDNRGGLNLLTGIGAICSFGVAAAATICIIFIGNRQKHKQNQMLRFQIFSDDKRMKQVVHHASKLNEAISAVRGVSINRAQITVGGYYDAV